MAAATPHGNITREVLLNLGLTSSGIDRRVRGGRLFPSDHRGVYGVGRPPRTGIERADAAVQKCGPGAGLFGGSAMTLWGFWRKWEEPFEVVVPGDRRPSGIIVHTSKFLGPAEMTRQHGISVTRPARTFFDMAPRLTDAQLKRHVNNALHSHYLKRGHLEEHLLRHPSHPAADRLRYFVVTEGGPTRSDWERALPTYCATYDLPIPIFGLMVAGYEADATWVDERIVIELDSWEYHHTRVDFETDRDRDVDRLAAGFLTVRLTWERMFSSSIREARRLHEVIATWGQPGLSGSASAPAPARRARTARNRAA